ncbi:hypothetical protein ScPMuIL_015630 [Solemya velum]
MASLHSMVLVLVVAVGVLSVKPPKRCREEYEDWTFLKKYSELEREFRLLRCLATYCRNLFREKPRDLILCFGRFSVPIYMEFFKENIFN